MIDIDITDITNITKKKEKLYAYIIIYYNNNTHNLQNKRFCILLYRHIHRMCLYRSAEGVRMAALSVGEYPKSQTAHQTKQ